MPNLLTITRILFSTLIALILIFFPSKMSYLISFILFCLAGITDFFDGWLARKKNKISDLGRMLDPIADKILVISTLVVLISNDVIEGYNLIAALTIIYREIFISGLREFLGNKSLVVNVTKAAKWKTAIQFITISSFLASKVIDDYFLYTGMVCSILIWVTSIISLYTGINYLNGASNYFKIKRK
jgi:cardiolipin synthase